jgi:hypothetical protein
MTRRRLTDRDRDQIRARYLAGQAQDAIAAALGLGVRTVTTAIAAAGLKAADRLVQPKQTGGAVPLKPLADVALQAYSVLGEPPADILARIDWYGRFIDLASWREMTGLRVDGEREMVNRVVGLVKVAQALVPQSVLFHAKNAIQKDADELEKPGGPEVEHAPQVADRAYRGAPRRGRPRKL